MSVTCGRTRTLLLLFVACCYSGHLVHAIREGHASASDPNAHISRRTTHKRRLEASSSESGAVDSISSSAAAHRTGRRYLADSETGPGTAEYDYWLLPPPPPPSPPPPPLPPGGSKAPGQGLPSYNTAQSVMSQVASHMKDLTADLDLEAHNGGRVPATSVDNMPSAESPSWEHMDTTVRVAEGRVAQATCVLPGANLTAIMWPVYGDLTIGCNSTLSYSMLSAACLGLRSCALYASNEVFGDPCAGVRKTLTFTYRCTAPADGVQPPDNSTAPPSPSPPPPSPSSSPPPPSPSPPSPSPPPPLPSPPSPFPPPPPSPRPSPPPPRPPPPTLLQTNPVPTRLVTPISPNPPALDVHFPPTALPRVPANRKPGCPLLGGSNVKDHGAAGNGFANEASALRRADAASGASVLFFPVGVYRISSSLTLTKPVLMGASTRFFVDSGVTLRLLAQPKRAPLSNDPMFAGPGKVVFGSAGLEIFPQWWIGPDRSQTASLQAAADSCELPCTLVQTINLNLNAGVYLSPRNGFFANSKALLVGSGAGEGVSLRPGSYLLPISFTGIINFAKWGLRLLPGVSNVDVQSGIVTNNGEGIVLAASPTQPLTNATISHVSVTQNNQWTTVVYSTEDTALFRDVTVRINFELMGGSKQPSRPSAGVVFRGGVPTLRNTQIINQAIDPAQFLVRTPWVAATTETSKPVSNFIFRSDCWNGGFEAPGALVDGRFRNSLFLIFTSGSIKGRIFAFGAGSTGNTLSMGNNAAAGEWTLSGTANAPATFNGGKPAVEQGLWVSIRSTSDWAPNTRRIFYLHSYFAAATNPATRMLCIPFAQWNPGVVCDSVQPTSTQPSSMQVAITLTNRSNRIIPAGFYHRFGVQVAP